MYSNNAYNIYKKNSVNFASKEQLLLMLLDGAVTFVKTARQGIEENNIIKAHENIMKTEDIFIELMATLDVQKGGAWARDLMLVYEFINDQLAKANIKKSIEVLDEIIPLIEDIRDTWNEAYKLSKRD